MRPPRSRPRSHSKAAVARSRGSPRCSNSVVGSFGAALHSSGGIPRTPAACAFRQAPLGPAVRAQDQEVVPRAPRPNARLTNAQIAGVRGIQSQSHAWLHDIDGVENLWPWHIPSSLSHHHTHRRQPTGQPGRDRHDRTFFGRKTKLDDTTKATEMSTARSSGDAVPEHGGALQRRFLVSQARRALDARRRRVLGYKLLPKGHGELERALSRRGGHNRGAARAGAEVGAGSLVCPTSRQRAGASENGDLRAAPTGPGAPGDPTAVCPTATPERP
jgi:hypothetical protein